MKILIPDTLGSNISPAYRALLPNLTLRGIDHPEIVGDHPHGAWCGWLCGAPLQAAGGKHEIVFLQVLSSDGAASDFRDRLLDVIEQERPDYISMSWGSWDRQDDLTNMFLNMSWRKYTEKFAALRKEIGFTAFSAAGNNDANNSRHDVAFPQVLQAGELYIIGSSDAYGIPSKFSADGPVHAMAIGDQCVSPDASGSWHLWRGTSAACPKICGAIAARGLLHDEIPDLLYHQAEHPPAWTDRRPHPKWGYGSLEWMWQADIAKLPPELLPPRHISQINSTHAYSLDGQT